MEFCVLRTTATALAVALMVAVAASSPAIASPDRDVTEAMRYGASAPIGTPLADLDNDDDVSTVIALPFSINFFGEEYGFVCITENGSIFPRKTVAPDRCDRYNHPLGFLALRSSAPIISPFAADHTTHWGDGSPPQPTSPFGPYPAVYAGNTIIDGKDAFVVTWYRVKPYDNYNDVEPFPTWTHQVVLIDEGKTFAGQDGNDFTVEFNYGAIESDSEGYEPDDYVGMSGEGRRYGVGWASYREFVVASVSGRVITLAAAHNLDTNANFLFAEDADGDRMLVRIVDGTRLEFLDPDADMSFDPGDPLFVSEAFEFFPDTPTALLADLDEDGNLQSTALTANRTSNAPMNGRYIFGMSGGQTVGFEVPGMGTVTTTTTTTTTEPSWVASDGQPPVLPPGTGEWRQTDSTPVPLSLTTPTSRTVRYSADGIQVTFTGAPGTSAANGLVADANGEIVCEVCVALAAGQVIEVWMFSTPRLVAAHLTEDLPCQRFSVPVVAPLDGGGPVSAGAHTLQLALPTASGMQAVNVGVTVGGPVPASVPAGEGGLPIGAGLLMLLGAAGAVLVAGRRLATAG